MHERERRRLRSGTCWSSAAGPRAPRPATGSREAGHRVLVVEKKRFPREKTCGDGLTPRAVRQLARHGPRRPARRSSCASTVCARSPTASRSSSTWPEHPDFPDYGYVVRRRDLDEMVADAAVKAGRRRCGPAPRRSRPLVEDGLVAGAVVRQRDGVDRAGAGPLRGGRRRRQLPVRAGARHAPATARYPARAWRCAATSPARSTTSRGSRATSTSATATATTCPGTAGSSRWATAP